MTRSCATYPVIWRAPARATTRGSLSTANPSRVAAVSHLKGRSSRGPLDAPARRLTTKAAATTATATAAKATDPVTNPCGRLRIRGRHEKRGEDRDIEASLRENGSGDGGRALCHRRRWRLATTIRVASPARACNRVLPSRPIEYADNAARRRGRSPWLGRVIRSLHASARTTIDAAFASRAAVIHTHDTPARAAMTAPGWGPKRAAKTMATAMSEPTTRARARSAPCSAAHARVDRRQELCRRTRAVR